MIWGTTSIKERQADETSADFSLDCLMTKDYISIRVCATVQRGGYMLNFVHSHGRRMREVVLSRAIQGKVLIN